MDAFGVFAKPGGPAEIEIGEAELGCGSWVEGVQLQSYAHGPQETYFYREGVNGNARGGRER